MNIFTKTVVKVLVSLFLYFFFTSSVFAARSLTVSSNKTSLFGDEEMTITASASGFTDGESIYVKGAFYKNGSTNYFGYTKDGNNWINNSETKTSQRQVTIGQWDNILIVKSNFSDSGYKNFGEGDYKFKVGFYYTTSGGDLSDINWSDSILTVSLNEPDPTPTSVPPTNTPPTPTATTAPPQPTATQAPPTSTPKSPTATAKPTLKPTSKPTTASFTSAKKTPSPTKEVLGEKTSSPSATPTKAPEKKKVGGNTVVAAFFTGFGLILLAFCGILGFRIYKERKLNTPL